MLRPLPLLALLALVAGPVAAQHQDPNPTPAAPPDTTAEVSEGWDVSAAHGPTKEVRFTTTEGTWMNLDVSPDGRTIVFDLLGDLYLLPIEGGTARRITSGPAFDLQPRFSPDGSRISFTSDRAGGDNIWTMAAEPAPAEAGGSDAQQVTKEDFRLLNNAVWTPDGEYLVARKHFTSGRSLGAGEMWMVHRSGGAGLQLTERRNDQQDAGEPALSPDGRYLYFSEDLTPGPNFEYNKDPNAGIYAIRRLDRETGDLETILRGPGGAARPQPSPDGRHLAFVRRVRDETALFLYDTETGAETPLTGGLSRDQQETWAIFGVYPNYAWLPDGSALVIWAQGGLHRVDAETGAMTAIPFSAEVELTVTEAVRSERPAATDRFTVRMIRDAATSPDGRTLVFSALGHLWQKRGDARPARLTSDAHFEYDPAFSPDGRTLVYTTWSDDDLGAVRALDLASGRSRALTTRPGHYQTPRFSPDGRQVVVQRGGGSGLRGGLHTLDTGLWVMNADGSGARLVTEDGRDPVFSADGSRIVYLTGGGLNKQVKSVDVDGSDCRPDECGERTHFTLAYATDVVPSPDGRYVAFVEAFNVYVAPFPQTGGAVALSKDTKAIPVARVSRDAGTDLHWTDATTLRWLIGEEVFTRSLDDAFAFRAGAPDDLPDPDSTGTPIGLVVDHARPEGTVAFVGARVITMDGDRVIEDGTVVVRGNRIVAVGPRADVDVPAGAETIDAAGKTIMPGIVDVHAHAGHFGGGPLPQANWNYYANLAFGVTTMHDPSASTELVFSLSEMVRAGEIVGPRVFSTGGILYGADGDIRVQINSLDDARSHLRRLQAVGAFSVKSYNQPRREQRQQILTAARELDMLVMPEGGSTFFHNVNMVVDGHTGIEHAVAVAPLYNDVLTLWGETRVGYTPTLVVGYGGLWGENYWYAESDVWENERLLRFTPRGQVDARSRRRVTAPASEWWHITLAEAADDLRARGVPVYLGAHGQLQGLGAQWELWSLAQGGMTPLQTIRAATLDGAAYLGMAGDLGSIETGKLADLLVLDGNPLEDIRQTASIRYTVADGRVFEAETMDQIWPAAVARPTFWFERPGASDARLWQTGHGDD
ncbi:amidohydrolase family protein [Rubrivirga sp. IMCC45206]|uniref:amidohydrolase family protein n=1 Tax=Rubrivirga sp. IMCC45206 TaxID=3391614 RepID=UPI00398FC17E